MKNRLSDSSGYKNHAVVIGDVQHKATIRRLPMRPGDNESRYRVRVTRSIFNGAELGSSYRDMDISKAYRVFEQNIARLDAMVG